MARSRMSPLARMLLASSALVLAAPLVPTAVGVALAPMAMAQTAPVVAENLVIDLGPVRYVIPRIEATGTSLTGADIADIFDGKSGRPIAERLSRLTAAAIVLPEVRFEQSAGEVKAKGVYRDLRLEDVAAGRIARVTGAGATLEFDGPNARGLTGQIGQLAATNTDIPAIARMLTEARKDANAPLVPLYDSFTMDGYRLGDGKLVDVNIGKLAGRDVRGRPMARPFVELLKDFPQTKPGEKPTPEQQRAVATFFVDVFSGFSMGLMEATDIRFKAGEGSKRVEARIARVGMRDFGEGRLGEVYYEGFDLTAPDGMFKLGRFAFRGLDFSATLKAIQKGVTLGNFEAVPPREYIPSLAGVEFVGLDFDVPDKGKSAASRIRMSLGKFEIGARNYILGIPTAITSQLDKFSFPLPPDDPRLRDLIALGYQKLDMSTRLDIAWNESAREISLNEYSASIEGMGSVKLSGVFGNAPRELFASNLAMVQAAALGAVIKSAKLRIVNTGLYEKAIATEARRQNKSPDEVRRTLVQGAAVGIPAILDNAPQARDLANAISKFLADAKTLTIEATAPNGLGAADLGLLGNPGELIKRVEIKASAND